MIIGISIFLLVVRKESQIVSTIQQDYTGRHFLTEDTTRGVIDINIHVEIPIAYVDTQVLSIIRAAICNELFGDFYNRYPMDSLVYYFAEDLKREYYANNLPFADKIKGTSQMAFNNTVILEGFSLLNDEHIFSYGILRDIDLGGTFPAKSRLFYNFDLRNGNILREQDIFVEGFETELIELLRAAIIKNSKLDDEIPAFNTLEESLYFIDAIQPNGNFYINDEGICYVFNPYEIAPIHYTGETEVTLPYTILQHLFREENPLQHLLFAKE